MPGGKMGISAVPGSGKTRTLAELAARLVAERIDDDQQVLIVTLVNSAVDNFRSRINESVQKLGLLPNFGYRVRTLHGLSHDIVRERPGLVGLSDDFGIIDEREADAVRDDAVDSWLRANPDVADPYLSRDLEGGRADWSQSAPLAPPGAQCGERLYQAGQGPPDCPRGAAGTPGAPRGTGRPGSPARFPDAGPHGCRDLCRLPAQPRLPGRRRLFRPDPARPGGAAPRP